MPKKLAAFIAQVSVPLLMLFALALPGVPQTQDPAAQKQRPRKVFPDQQEPDEILRFDTDLVSVDVTAIDAEGRPVKNLRQEDFKVFSDGVEQPISFFQIEQRQGEARPLAIGFALDLDRLANQRKGHRVAVGLEADQVIGGDDPALASGQRERWLAAGRDQGGLFRF